VTITHEQLNEMGQQWPVEARPNGVHYDWNAIGPKRAKYWQSRLQNRMELDHVILMHIATGILYSGVGIDEGINGRFWTFTTETSNPYRPDVERVKYDTPIEAVHAAVMATAAVAAKYKGKQ